MTDQHQDWLKEQPAAVLILAGYAEREALLPKRVARQAATAAVPVVSVGENETPADGDETVSEAENADSWVPRVTLLEGVDSVLLSQLHGGLIARGLLKYELFGRQFGVRYRLTPDGRRAAEPGATTPAETTMLEAAA